MHSKDYWKFMTHNGQPVSKVLAYLHVQISPISCNVVWYNIATDSLTLILGIDTCSQYQHVF